MRNIELSRGEATDLASLWGKAVKEYERSANIKTSHMNNHSAQQVAQNLSQIMDASEEKTKLFESHRHRKDKVSKARSSVGKHLEGMQKCLGGISMVGGAAAVFPPAMPVTIIFAACDRVLGAFLSVRDEMDKIEQFLALSNRFFERLSIIESSKCSDGPLAQAIVRVFSAQLSVYAVVEEVVVRKNGRIKMFFEALWEPQNPRLYGSYALMESSIEELDKTINFANHAAIRGTQEVTTQLDEKTNEMNNMLLAWREQQSEDIFKLFESTLELKVDFQLKHVATMNRMSEMEQNIMEALAKANAQNKKATENRSGDTERSKPGSKPNGKKDISDKRSQALLPLKAYFDDAANGFLNWNVAQRQNSALHQDYKSDFVKGTADWLFAEPAWDQWISGQHPVLWMRGADGVGKSFLAYAGARRLLEQADNYSIAYFHFREEIACLQSVQNAIACTALQIAELDMKYARFMCNKLADKDKNGTNTTPWQQFFFSAYAKDSVDHTADSLQDQTLFLLFDGLDELPEEQLQVFRLFLTDLIRSKPRIRVLISSRPEQEFIDEANPLIIDVLTEKMSHDINIFIRDRLTSGAFPRLKKFSTAAKKTIRRKVAKQADGMLYADHMLRRLSYIGREGAVLRDIEHMPSGLRGLYKILLDECRRGRSPQQYEALKKLFAWLAFSKRPLSLAEASELVAITITDEDFDLEDEIIGRSARILELTPVSRAEEENHDEGQEDDNEDADGETALNVDEYREAPLTFQERSLRQYFRAVSVEQHGLDELRTPAKAAHTTILSMCLDILRKSTAMTKDGRGPALRGYAVKYWYEHFAELDVDAATDVEIGQTLEVLHSILTDEKRVSRLFDHYAVQSELYAEAKEGESMPWYDRILPWVRKAADISEDLIAEPIRTWACNVIADEHHVLEQLSRAHIKNWLSLRSHFSITQAYKNAEITTRICGRIDDPELDPWERIMSVAQHFELTIEKKAMRTVGVTLFHSEQTACSETREALQLTAMSYLNDCLSATEDDGLESGGILLNLSAMHEAIGKPQEAFDTIDKAIKTYEAYNLSLKTDPPPKFREVYLWNDRPDVMLWSLFRTKASYLAGLDRKDEAFQAYEESRKLALQEFDGVLNGWVLEDIAQLFDEDRDPDGHGFMNALKTWNERELRTWFNYHFLPFADVDALGRMFRASKLTGETDLVLTWLNTYGKALQPRSLAAFNLQYALAEYYSSVIGDVDKAKGALHSVLTFEPKMDISQKDIVDSERSEARLRIAGIIFAQFSASNDPARKEELINELKHLPGTSEGEVTLNESHIGMLYANMLRIMGPAREYQKQMNQIFQSCIEGLSDEDSFNDGPTLRLLAKVLSFLDGLEFDARIALSAQFSVLDRELHAAGLAKLKMDAESESSESTHSDDDETDDKSIPEGSNVEDGATASDHGLVDENPASEHEVTILGSDIPPSMVAVPDDNSPEEKESPEDQGEKESLEDQGDDQDITGEMWGVGCDGQCGAGMQQWEQPFYLCLICPNIDLCVDCLKKKRASKGEESEQSWKQVCNPDHCFIKGPMKGWKGVKEGVIRIEGRESFTVKQWLKEVKEERWARAWERYWLKQGGLRNIEDEE